MRFYITNPVPAAAALRTDNGPHYLPRLTLTVRKLPEFMKRGKKKKKNDPSLFILSLHLRQRNLLYYTFCLFIIYIFSPLLCHGEFTIG